MYLYKYNAWYLLVILCSILKDITDNKSIFYLRWFVAQFYKIHHIGPHINNNWFIRKYNLKFWSMYHFYLNYYKNYMFSDSWYANFSLKTTSYLHNIQLANYFRFEATEMRWWLFRRRSNRNEHHIRVNHDTILNLTLEHCTYNIYFHNRRLIVVIR